MASALGEQLWISKGVVDISELPKVVSNACSGIIFIDTQYKGGTIFLLGYNTATKVAGNSQFDNYVQMNGYQLTIYGACQYILFNLQPGGIN